jgi:hypothetical protein
MKRVVHLQVLMVLVALLAPALARAATVLHLELPDAVAQATQVVHGDVLDADTHWSDDGLRIYTDLTVGVRRTLKGAASEAVRVRTLGGIVGGIGQTYPGAPQLRVGEEVVLLLQDPIAGQEKAPQRIVGLGQGVYRVTRARGEAIAFQELDGLQRIDPVTGLAKDGATDPLPLESLLDRIQVLAGRRP